MAGAHGGRVFVVARGVELLRGGVAGCRAAVRDGEIVAQEVFGRQTQRFEGGQAGPRGLWRDHLLRWAGALGWASAPS